jgi:glutamate racemase
MISKNIGIFDSGVGGLTVLREITKLLPNEDIVYFGDTARVPYGSKSRERILEYSFQDAAFLLSHNVKIIVIACNSASSTALQKLQDNLSVPLLGVIEPGALEAVRFSKNKKVGVIGTKATVESHSYTNAVHSLVGNDTSYEVFEKACPLFVPLTEDGWIDHTITHLVAEEYLSPLKEKGIDTLILGCTHYPLIKKTIQRVIGDEVSLVDSSVVVARELVRLLKFHDILNDQRRKGRIECFVSDDPDNFFTMAKLFLGDTKIDINEVSLDLIISQTV